MHRKYLFNNNLIKMLRISSSIFAKQIYPSLAYIFRLKNIFQMSVASVVRATKFAGGNSARNRDWKNPESVTRKRKNRWYNSEYRVLIEVGKEEGSARRQV